MIKKIILILAFVLLIIASTYYIFLSNKPKIDRIDSSVDDKSKIVNLTKSVTPTAIQSVTKEGYQLNYLIVRPTDIIELYSNLDLKLPSSEVRSKYGCNSIVSGNFYGTDGKHLGLFISQGKLISSDIESTLFDGFFLIDNDKKPSIVNFVKNMENIRVGVQSGPLLFLNNQPLDLSSKNKDYARRIIAAINNRGEIIFIVINSKNNFVSGPSLSELPTILSELNKTTSLKIVQAINLDGGSHSTFISGTTNFTELATAGSFFCIKSN